LMLNHLVGPSAQARPNSELFSTALSRDQAAILFSLASKMVRLDPMLRDLVKIRESTKVMSCPELGTKFESLSAESSLALGRSPALHIWDEGGAVVGPRFALYENMESATGAISHPLTIIISTQAASSSDILSLLIDSALRGDDPKVICHLYSAPLDIDPFSEKAVRAANPGFDYFQNKEEILAMAATAKRMPSLANRYKQLTLNQRVSASSPFVSPEIWALNAGPPKDFTGLPVYAAIDLAESDDMTALVLMHVDADAILFHAEREPARECARLARATRFVGRCSVHRAVRRPNH